MPTPTQLLTEPTVFKTGPKAAWVRPAYVIKNHIPYSIGARCIVPPYATDLQLPCQSFLTIGNVLIFNLNCFTQVSYFNSSPGSIAAEGAWADDGG